MIDCKAQAVSRRELLARGVGMLAIVTALTTVDVAKGDAQQKMAQKLVQYQETPKNNQKCSTCVHYVDPNSCKLVEGKINPEGWCALFAPKPK